MILMLNKNNIKFYQNRSYNKQICDLLPFIESVLGPSGMYYHLECMKFDFAIFNSVKYRNQKLCHLGH